ncbi:MAG: hypothetical protein FWG78_02445, partial [Coriobacteriia bacterium]|nr:hypothetical protein [Coriobacteriia bacterium]
MSETTVGQTSEQLGSSDINDGPRSRRRQNATIAIIIAILLLLLGAFAWGAIQSAINQFANDATPDALLHDVFSRTDEENWQKEVWVENTGNVPFIARIQAREFMQWIDSEDWDAGRNLLTNGAPFAPLIDANEQKMLDTLQESNWGDLIGTRTPDPNIPSDVGDMWFAVEDSWWRPFGVVLPTEVGHTPSRMFRDWWDWGFTGTGTTSGLTANVRAYDAGMATVMGVAVWAGEPNMWVYAEDGYFYYSSAINGDQSTSLLLNGVSYGDDDLANRAFYYAIDITMEVVTQDDVRVMRDGVGQTVNGLTMEAAGLNGKAIINGIWPPEASTFDPSIAYPWESAPLSFAGLDFIALPASRQMVGGNQYELIVSKDALFTSAYVASGNYVGYNASALKTEVDSWFNNGKAFDNSTAMPSLADLRAQAHVMPTFPTESTTVYSFTDVTAPEARWADELTVPSATLRGATTAGVAFPLSVGEIMTYMTPFDEGGNYTWSNRGSVRKATGINNNTSSAAQWLHQWLRSPGTSATTAARVDGNGTVVGDSTA